MVRSLWSLPLFSAFGVRVKADLYLLVFIAVELLRAAPEGRLAPVAMAMGLLFLSVLLHEAGHCLAARRLGGRAEEIVLWPLGGISSVEAPRTPRAQFLTAFAGPAVNLLLAALAGGWLLLQGGALAKDLLAWQPSWTANAFRINLGLFLFNLIPAFPLDGGQMLRALLWGRMGFGEATALSVRVGKVAAVLMAVAGLAAGHWLLVGIAVVAFIACEQERLLLESGALEGEEAGFPFPRELEEAPEPRGWGARRRRARREREEQERRRREGRLRARMDAILEKINRVGMQGLSREERATLQEASDLFRHSRR